MHTIHHHWRDDKNDIKHHIEICAYSFSSNPMTNYYYQTKRFKPFGIVEDCGQFSRFNFKDTQTEEDDFVQMMPCMAHSLTFNAYVRDQRDTYQKLWFWKENIFSNNEFSPHFYCPLNDQMGNSFAMPFSWEEENIYANLIRS